MSATFYQAASWTTVGTAVGNAGYKDVTVACSSGDLLVAFGASANASASPAGSLATQSGTTSAWTVGYQNNTDSTAGYIMGHAVSSTNGSVTVRVTVAGSSTGSLMGAGVWVVPAAEWQGTPSYTTFGTNVADASPSVTLAPSSSTVLYGAADWSGNGAAGTSYTPAGATVDVNAFQSGQYAAAAGRWTGQASGTRDYGPSSPGGDQYTGAVIEIEEPPTGPQPQAIPVSFVAVGAYSTSGSTAPLSIPVPAGLQEGDLAVAVITSKAASTTFISSSGWVQAYQSAVLGGGTVGTGTGPVYVTIMTRVVPAGGLTGPVSFSFNATPNSYVGVMFGLRYDATGMTSPSWNATSLTGTSYSRTTASTTFGGTGAADLGLATYDWVVFASASADDQSSNHSSSGVPAISATGATLTGTTTRSGTGVTTTGGDCSQWVGTASVTAGASTAAPVMANLTSNSSETGGGVFVKIRATALPGTTPVAASRSTSWAVAQQVASSRATTWNVLENLIAVASSRATSWRVLRAETSSRATTWRTAATVTGSRATSWRTLAQVQAARASSWAVLVAVAASRATTWRTLAEVAASRATSWAVDGLAAVASSRATTWAVRAATSAARSTTWAVRTPASSSRATTWSTRSVVEASRQTTWRVLSQVSGSRSTTWTTRSVVSAVRSTSWRVLRVVTASRSTLWAVAGELVSVAASRSTTWAVQAYAQVAASRATSWATRSAVAPASRSTSWAVLSSRLAARSTSWRVSEQVSSSRPTSWETRAQVAASRLALWETLEAVTTSRSTTWAVAEPAFSGGHIEVDLAFPVQAALSGVIHAAIGSGGLTATLGAAPHAGLNLSQIVE